MSYGYCPRRGLFHRQPGSTCSLTTQSAWAESNRHCSGPNGECYHKHFTLMTDGLAVRGAPTWCRPTFSRSSGGTNLNERTNETEPGRGIAPRYEPYESPLVLDATRHVAMRGGIEPPSLGLTGPCSATELPHRGGPPRGCDPESKNRNTSAGTAPREGRAASGAVGLSKNGGHTSPSAGEKGIEPHPRGFRVRGTALVLPNSDSSYSQCAGRIAPFAPLARFGQMRGLGGTRTLTDRCKRPACCFDTTSPIGCTQIGVLPVDPRGLEPRSSRLKGACSALSYESDSFPFGSRFIVSSNLLLPLTAFPVGPGADARPLPRRREAPVRGRRRISGPEMPKATADLSGWPSQRSRVRSLTPSLAPPPA